MRWIATKNQWISKHQFGFMKNKSTILATNELVAHIEKGFKKKKMTLAILLDIEGAFDNASVFSGSNGRLYNSV